MGNGKWEIPFTLTSYNSILLLTSHISLLTSPISHFTPHLSHLTSHISQPNLFLPEKRSIFVFVTITVKYFLKSLYE
jgi:hypothetical protein